jgi:hypothetical protein
MLEDLKLYDFLYNKFLDMPEWAYAKDYIVIMQTERKCYDESATINDKWIILKGIETSWQDVIKVTQNHDHELNYRWGGLCKNLVYGDRYVVTFKNFGNIHFHSGGGGHDSWGGYGISDKNGLEGRLYELEGNLLIEYSKKLRGEENRLEELEGLIKV